MPGKHAPDGSNETLVYQNLQDRAISLLLRVRLDLSAARSYYLRMRKKRGFFITFEGIEGSGKSTAAFSGADFLQSLGREIVRTREPGGTKFAEKIRELILNSRESKQLSPVEELFLFSASRARHTREIIIPALDAGRDVISDRFADSTLAYQGAGGALTDAQINFVSAIATGGLSPDLTILLDLPAEEGLARRRIAGSQNWIDRRELDYHEAVRARYLEIAAANPERVKIVDSAGSAEKTFLQVRILLAELAEK